MADDDDDTQLQAALDQIWEEHKAGNITTLEYNTRRRELKAQARAKSAGAAAVASPESTSTPAPADAPSADAPSADAPSADAPSADATPPALTVVEGAAVTPSPSEAPASAPSAWGDSQPKHWGSRGRGDDPSVRETLPPLASGIGDGKSFLFIFGLRVARDTDQMMVRRETEQIQDDIELLRKHGFTVVLDPQGGKQDFLDALYGQGEGVEGLVPAGIYWSAHGHDDGRVECCDGSLVAPGDVETAKVSPGLRLMVFGACYTGSFARTWRGALGGHPLVVGWGRPVTIDRAVEFLQTHEDTDTDFDDLVARYVLADTPIPPLPEQGQQPPAVEGARKDEMLPRVQNISDLLSGVWREQENFVEIRLPLAGGRRHVVRLFVRLATHEFIEGRPLVGVEAEVGELSRLVEPEVLLQPIGVPGFARVALVRGKNDMPDIVVQGFLPQAHATDTDIAALAYQVARAADELELRIFGSDRPY
ncbi:MAG: hypothetical protein IPK74_07855 [Deltaproteobacteria bacterium]|nr:hypothetical protein [Deltaproteobacteria bacterium]